MIKRELLSFPSGKNIFFNELKNGDNLLLLYEDGIDIHSIFLSFIENGLSNRDSCFYAFDVENNKLDFDKFGNNKAFFTFPFKRLYSGNIMNQFENKFEKVCYSTESKGHVLRIIVDWGRIGNYGKKDKVMDCISSILEKQGPKPWRGPWKKHKPSKQKLHIVINAFNAGHLDNETIKSLVALHKKVIITTKSHSFASLPSVSQISHFNSNLLDFDSIQEEVMEQVIKKNLEMIVLNILQKRGMCGYDVIKTIARRFHVVLPQGTVYPLLYSLEKKGFLKTNSSSREKIYQLTEQGKKYANNRLNNFTKAYQHLFSHFCKVGGRYANSLRNNRPAKA